MASAVDIANLSLARLGDDATVSSMDPPEGSAQAAHAARFYPIARDAMLEMHDWGFATKRAQLALLASTPPSQWKFAYAAPADMNNPVNVYASDAPSDTTTNFSQSWVRPGLPNSSLGMPTPQPYATETDANGNTVIYSNQENAVLLYTALVTDTTKFSPLFVTGLSILLASHLAGPVLKGEVGRSEARALLQEFRNWLTEAKVSDSNQHKADTRSAPAWVANR